MYLLIDNYDSFTYNLYQMFLEEHVNIVVKRNDEISIKDIEIMDPEKIIISPGPKTPKNAGISIEIIKNFSGKIPILGICLGHQCIVEAFGGTISRVNKMVHGKTTPVYHENKEIFDNIPSPFAGARYHSLTVKDLPECLRKIAWTENDIIMGIKHKGLPVIGLQFHPESFLTEHGKNLIKNFIEM